jgi:hypothetical protein
MPYSKTKKPNFLLALGNPSPKSMFPSKGQERVTTNRIAGSRVHDKGKKSVEPTPEFRKKMGIK